MNTEHTMEKRPETTVVTAERTRSRPTFSPNVDILETAEELRLLADMPGVRSEDIDVRFENGTLIIHGVVSDRQAESARFLRREYGVGDFYRTFQVSEMIDAGKIGAEYADGVLTLRLPKCEAAKPRKIAVKGK